MKGQDWEAQAATTQRNINTKRHAKYINNFTQEDIIGYLAQIRLLEDEIMAERFKSQKLQAQNYELVQTITHLEKSVSQLRFLLQKADLEIKRHYQTNKQFESYSKNLKQAGHELSSMNQIVEKKNKQCQKLGQLNAKFKQENAELQNKLKLFQSRRELQKSKIRQILQSLNTDTEPSFTDDLIRDIQLLEYGIQDLRQNLNKSKNALEKHRKDTSEMLIKQKQKIIGLQYSLKLSEQRNKDLEKKRNIQSTLTFDKKIEDLIDQMLKKEEQLAIRVNQLELQNQQIRQQLENQRVAEYHLVELSKKQLQKQLKEAKEVIKQLITEKDQLTDRLEQFSNIKQMESSRFMSQQLELSRKNRQFYEQNRRLKIKINQLESDKKMLQKELCIRNNI